MNRNLENANAMGNTINRRLHAAYERYLAEPERRPEDAEHLADDYEDVQRRIIEDHLMEEDIGRDAAGYCNCRHCIDDDCDSDDLDEREEP